MGAALPAHALDVNMVGLLVVLALLTIIFGRKALLGWLDGLWTAICVLILVGLCFAFPPLAWGLGAVAAIFVGWYVWAFHIQDAVQDANRQHQTRQKEEATEQQVARLKRLLAAGNPAECVKTCGEMATQRTLLQAVQPLVVAANDADGSRRNCALLGLKLCAENGLSTGSTARERLADDTEWTINRVLAAETIGAKLDDEGIAALFQALSDREPQVRAAAALGLGKAARSHYGLPVTDWLLPLLGDPVPEVRVAAAEALGKTRDPKALRPLQAVNADSQQSRDVREAALTAVTELRNG